MLLPDTVQPKNSVYYNGALVLEVMQDVKNINFLDLFAMTRQKSGMSMGIFILCLDWLYLIDAVMLDDNGNVGLCF